MNRQHLPVSYHTETDRCTWFHNQQKEITIPEGTVLGIADRSVTTKVLGPRGETGKIQRDGQGARRAADGKQQTVS